MKKIFLLLLILVFVFSCNKKETKENDSKSLDKKLKIVTTLFPTYDFSRELGKEKVDVLLLLPPGVEAHSYEPTPKDIASINNADIFIFTGENMEPWVVKLLNSLTNKNLIVVDVSKGINLRKFEEDDNHKDKNHEDHSHEEDHIHGEDPHIWTDPVLAKIIVKNIFDALSEIDSKNSNFYKENLENYDKKLDDLNKKFEDLVKKSTKNEIVTGGHFVFSYLFDRLGLKYHNAYEGFSPNAEPTPKQMKLLKETIKETQSEYIYYEELLEPKLAKLLSEEFRLKLLLLHGAHNISKEELQKNVSYYDIMSQNIENLKLGLDYNE